jgi:hypothetical protein
MPQEHQRFLMGGPGMHCELKALAVDVVEDRRK